MSKFYILFLTIFITNAHAQNHKILEKYSQSKYCAGCHPDQVRDWKYFSQLLYLEARSVELIKRTLKHGGNNPSQSCFPASGRAIKKHMGQGIGFDQLAQRSVYAKQVLLAEDGVKCGRAVLVCEEHEDVIRSFFQKIFCW